MTKLTVVFRNFVNAPKKGKGLHPTQRRFGATKRRQFWFHWIRIWQFRGLNIRTNASNTEMLLGATTLAW